MLALGCALAGTSLADTVPISPLQLRVAAASTTFNIPSGDLATALETFSRQTGVSVVFDSRKIQGLTTPGLNGNYEIQAGLDVLLQGTGYVSTPSGEGYSLVPAPPAAAMLTIPPLGT
jgi:hypothetical protein